MYRYIVDRTYEKQYISINIDIFSISIYIFSLSTIDIHILHIDLHNINVFIYKSIYLQYRYYFFKNRYTYFQYRYLYFQYRNLFSANISIYFQYRYYFNIDLNIFNIDIHIFIIDIRFLFRYFLFIIFYLREPYTQREQQYCLGSLEFIKIALGKIHNSTPIKIVSHIFSRYRRRRRRHAKNFWVQLNLEHKSAGFTCAAYAKCTGNL